MATDYIEKLDGKHNSKDLQTLVSGNMHARLGMIIDYSVTRNICAVTKYDVIKKSHMNLSESLKGPCRSILAPENLFEVDRM